MTPNSFRAFAGDDNCSPRFEDVNDAYHALDRLVVGLVQGIACTSCKNGLETAGQSHLCMVSHEFHCLQVAGLDFPKIDKPDTPFFINGDVQAYNSTDSANDF